MLNTNTITYIKCLIDCVNFAHKDWINWNIVIFYTNILVEDHDIVNLNK